MLDIKDKLKNAKTNETNNISSMNADVSKFKLLQISQIVNDTPPIDEYVFHPCLKTQGICLIYAGAGSGKTLFTLNLAVDISQGGNFLKYKCPKARRVLYVDGEMSYKDIYKRCLSIYERKGKEIYFDENFFILTADKQNGIFIPKIDDEFGQSTYDKLINEYNIEVIVFDNLSSLSSIDENKSCEWSLIQDWFLRLKSTGKSIILIHHAGKDKNGYRGTSKMLDVIDTAISLQKIEDVKMDDDVTPTTKFKIHYHKARYFNGKDALPYEVTITDHIWSYKSNDLSLIDQIVDCYKAKMTQREIAKDLGISQPKVCRLISHARELGKLA